MTPLVLNLYNLIKVPPRQAMGEHLMNRHSGPVRNRDQPGYHSWLHMNRRCLNKSNRSYHRYGGRGIKVCERWHRGTSNSFNNFMEDMGPKPAGPYSIDRIDNMGNYEPENCRWATQTAQQNNRQNNIVIKIGPHSRTAAEWARETGVNAATIRWRWHKGIRGVGLIRLPKIQSGPRNITVDGITRRLCEWAKISGNTSGAIRGRLAAGTDAKDAVFAPSDRGKRLDGKMRNQDRKDCVFLTVGDETHHVAEWSRRTGLSEGAIRHRIKIGWPPADVVTKPSRKKRK